MPKAIKLTQIKPPTPYCPICKDVRLRRRTKAPITPVITNIYGINEITYLECPDCEAEFEDVK